MTEYVSWNLDPFFPARDDVIGEVVFMRRWHAAMGGRTQEHDVWFLENEPSRHPLIEVYGGRGYPSARDARVMTTVVRWIGSPNGLHFLEECRRKAVEGAIGLAQVGVHYVLWAVQNAPDTGSQTRIHLLAGETPTAHDIIVMELTVMWLDGKNGRKFVDDALAEIEVLRAEAKASRASLSARPGPSGASVAAPVPRGGTLATSADVTT